MRTLFTFSLLNTALFYKLPVAYFCFTIFHHSSSNQNENTNLIMKRRYDSYFSNSPKKKHRRHPKPAIDLIHSWGLEVVIGNNWLMITYLKPERYHCRFQLEVLSGQSKISKPFGVFCGGYGTKNTD
jgi:hypothetical protein